MENKKLIITKKKYGNESAVMTSRLPVELINQIDKTAEATGKSRNEIVQLCLEFAMSNIEISD